MNQFIGAILIAGSQIFKPFTGALGFFYRVLFVVKLDLFQNCRFQFYTGFMGK
jgi:hypothetical protein